MNEHPNDSQKKRTTIYISADVLEYLAIRRAKGAGSISQQLEDLARAKMPRRYGAREIAALERQHAEGYAKHPVEQGEFDVWEAEQTWSES